MGRYLEAIECYNKAIELRSRYAEAMNNKGTSLYHMGRYEEAIDCYTKAIEFDPDFALAHKNRRITLNFLNR
jgi:tetratricopeptide (TPR) repeat protein